MAAPGSPQVGRRRGGQPTVTDVAAAIRAGIVNGDYAPNQRLIEADLVEAYGASRAIIRSALVEMAAEGLVGVAVEGAAGAVVGEVALLFQGGRQLLDCRHGNAALARRSDQLMRRGHEPDSVTGMRGGIAAVLGRTSSRSVLLVPV